MPFRVSDYVDLCAECTAPTELECPRCGKPLCPQHAPSATERCASCETEFEDNRQPLISLDALEKTSPATTPSATKRLALLSTGATILTLSFVVSADTFFAILLVVPMSCMVALEAGRSFGELVLRHRQIEARQARRRFLAERKPRLRVARS